MDSPLRRFKAETFQALAHPTRIAILEFLEAGELSAGTLIEKLEVEQANVSQHLAVLRARQLVTKRKVGTQVFYSLRDPIISEVLKLMKQYCTTHLRQSRASLKDLEAESVRSGKRIGKRPPPRPSRKTPLRAPLKRA